MNKPTVDQLIKIADVKGYPIFKSQGIFNYNLNLWGIRSLSKDATCYNDLLCVFYQNIKCKWTIDYFTITTDPSNLLLRKPENTEGTFILDETHHSKMWSFGFHKGRRDHKALVQFSPCHGHRDNNKNDVIDGVLTPAYGMFGINMHRASAYSNDSRIGLYSAGCQVHYDKNLYNNNFIPLIEACVREGNGIFSYTLINEKDLS